MNAPAVKTLREELSLQPHQQYIIVHFFYISAVIIAPSPLGRPDRPHYQNFVIFKRGSHCAKKTTQHYETVFFLGLKMLIKNSLFSGSVS